MEEKEERGGKGGKRMVSQALLLTLAKLQSRHHGANAFNIMNDERTTLRDLFSDEQEIDPSCAHFLGSSSCLAFLLDCDESINLNYS